MALAETSGRVAGGWFNGGAPRIVPAAVRIIDLDAPLADVLPRRPGGAPYRSLVAVARLGGEPLGAATIATDSQGWVSGDRLAAALYRELDAELREAFDRRGAQFPHSLPLDGLPRARAEDHRKRGRRHAVSVVVTTRANPIALERCLRSIMGCDYEPFEVIVVENRPRAGVTRRLLAERFDDVQDLRYVEESRSGLSHARNAGLAVADGDIVAFTSDDIVVDPGWIRCCVEGMASSDDVACVTGLILPFEIETERQLALERAAGFGQAFRPQTYRPHEFGEVHPRFPYTSCPAGLAANTAVRPDVVRQLGWFDVSLGVGTPAARGEDLDLYARLMQHGYAVAHHPSAVVWHATADGAAHPRREAYRYGVGVGAVRAKQGSSPETVSLPADLQSIKRAGMLVGPAAYALSRLAERRPRRLPAAPGAVDGRRTPVELMLRPDGHAVQVVTFRDRDVARPPSAPGWRPRPSARRPAAISWGATPALMLIAAFGLALVAVADALSRSGAGDGRPLFWAGVAAMVTPIAYRLASENIPRGERVALLTVFGLALYGVKLLRDPFAFTYADELVHVANVDAILRTGHLLTANSILPVTPLYPGLESVTAALASMTGLSAFAASAVTIGIARVLLTLGLYLFVEKLTGSARTGGLAALFYAAAPNYVFFIGQYSYESLGLPLACVALFAFARALRAATSSDSLRWSVVFVLLTAAIVVTHHMTTYALVAFLVAVAALTAVLRGVRPRWSPWILAGAAAVLTTVWLLSFADRTYAYLAPVIRGAIRGTFATVSGETAPRALFRPEAGPPAPPWERAVAIASVLALVLIMPFGLRTVWTRFRRSPMVLALAAAGMLYGATLPLRLVPRAWETASRASEFLFVGVAVVVALAGIERWRTDRVPSVGRWLVAAAAALLVSGGIMIGSPSAQRLAQSYRIERGGEAIDPQGVTAAQWVGSNLGPGNRFAAEQSDARLLQAYGRQFAIAGTYPDVVDILHARLLEPWMLQLLAEQRIRYVDVNRLKASANSGLYFFSPPGAWTAALFPGAVVSKFDRDARVDRLFDSGDVAIYDVGRLTGGRPPR